MAASDQLPAEATDLGDRILLAVAGGAALVAEAESLLRSLRDREWLPEHVEITVDAGRR